MKVECAALVMWLWATTMRTNRWSGWCVNSHQQTSFSSLSLKPLNVGKATGLPSSVIPLVLYPSAGHCFLPLSHVGSRTQVTLSVSRRHNSASDWPISSLFTESHCDTLSERVCDQPFAFSSITALSHHLLSARIIPLIESHQCCCPLSVVVSCFRPTCQISDYSKHLIYRICNTWQEIKQQDPKSQ